MVPCNDKTRVKPFLPNTDTAILVQSSTAILSYRLEATHFTSLKYICARSLNKKEVKCRIVSVNGLNLESHNMVKLRRPAECSPVTSNNPSQRYTYPEDFV